MTPGDVVDRMKEPRLDRATSALGHAYRRRLLIALADDRRVEDPVAALGDVSDPTRAWIRLYHVHLPLLDDLGYVEWDRERRAIARGPAWQEVAPLLDAFRRYDESA
jgi:hypothetical protein